MIESADTAVGVHPEATREMTSLLVRTGRTSGRPLAVAIDAGGFDQSEGQVQFVRADTTSAVTDVATRSARRSRDRWALAGEPVGGAAVVVGLPPRRAGQPRVDADLRAACVADIAAATQAFADDLIVTDDGLAGSDPLADLTTLTDQAVTAPVDPVAWTARGLVSAIAASAHHGTAADGHSTAFSELVVTVLGDTRDARALVSALHAAGATVVVGHAGRPTGDDMARTDVTRLDPAHARRVDTDALVLCGEHRLHEHDIDTLGCRVVIEPETQTPDLATALDAAGLLVVPETAATVGGALAGRLARRGAPTSQIVAHVDGIGATVHGILHHAGVSSTSPSAVAEAIARVRLVASGLFRRLPPDVLAGFATALEPEVVDAGRTVVRAGERGDRFFVIGHGRVQVLVDGRSVRVQGIGDFFGEIALLRDMTRSATVQALEPTVLYSVDRATFLGILDGEPGARAAAEAIVDQRLGHAATT